MYHSGRNILADVFQQKLKQNVPNLASTMHVCFFFLLLDWQLN